MNIENPKKSSEIEIEELKNDLGNKIDLHSLHDSAGGKLLIDTLVIDILGCIDRLSVDVETLSHMAMISLICKMKERLDIVKALTSAKAGEESCTDLLAEALKKQEEDKGGV